MKIVECVPNFSEGRRKDVIDAILHEAEGVHGITVLDCESDPNHNRMVLTFVGSPEAVVAAALASSAKAIELIDITKHRGEHPRMGAVDVVPFVPLREVSMGECVELAKEFAREFSSRYSVPVFLYERAASREERKNLANVREGQFEGLSERIGKDPSKDPDYGPKKIHPTAGATAVGARPVLIAYNVDLNSQDLSLAKKIAKRVRERDGGFPSVKALGFELKDRKLVQVSMNLTEYTKTSMHTVFDAVSAYSAENRVEVVDSEVVGLVPQEALIKASAHYLKLKDFKSDQVIENRIFEADIETESKGLDFGRMTLEEFSERVSSKDPTPGGGSVCAYAGVLAASLVAMVCKLTIQKKGYETTWKTAEEILRESDHLKEKLVELVSRDAASYTLVSDARKLPKNTELEKQARNSKILDALKVAVDVPSETMEASFEVLKLARQIFSVGNKNASSDAETAIDLAKASILGAWSNVRLNLESFANDQIYVATVKEKLVPLAEAASS